MLHGSHWHCASVFLWARCLCVCQKCLSFARVWCFSYCLSVVSLLQPDFVILPSDLIYSHLCCHRLIFVSPFVSFFLSCPTSPHMVSPLSSPSLRPRLSPVRHRLPETLSNWWRCRMTAGPWESTWCLSVGGTAGKNIRNCAGDEQWPQPPLGCKHLFYLLFFQVKMP